MKNITCLPTIEQVTKNEYRSIFAGVDVSRIYNGIPAYVTTVGATPEHHVFYIDDVKVPTQCLVLDTKIPLFDGNELTVNKNTIDPYDYAMQLIKQ